jgi:hypothetical protein
VNEQFLDYVRGRWPSLPTLIVTALFLAFATLVVAVWQQRWWLVLPAFVLALAAVYIGYARFWFAQQTQDYEQIVKWLWEIGDLSAENELTLIEPGSRHLAVSLGLRMRHGQVRVINIYNPHVTPELAFMQSKQSAAISRDPRLVWLNGRFDLLPTPDSKVTTVVSNQLLTVMPGVQDRDAMLDEIYRVLQPGGIWVLTERADPDGSIWSAGIGSRTQYSAETWHKQLTRNGFQIRTERQVNPLIVCFVLVKPGQRLPRQLRFKI